MRASRSVAISLLGLQYSVKCVGQIRPTEAELKEMGPEFNELWNTYFKDKPDKPVMCVLAS